MVRRVPCVCPSLRVALTVVLQYKTAKKNIRIDARPVGLILLCWQDRIEMRSACRRAYNTNLNRKAGTGTKYDVRSLVLALLPLATRSY